ncbi:MAG TPA: YggT family protein [Acidimicrobiia bacterium]|nr:YggT family protein [Acidimicrobiia bacterium]
MSQRDAQVTVGTIAKVLLWFVYAWVIVSLVLLVLAFLLELFGANPDSGFAQWVYRSVERTMAPFRGLFEPITFGKQSVLDTSVLFAMIVYGFVALFLKAAIDWVTDRTRQRRLRLDEEARTAQPGVATSTSRAMSGGDQTVQPPAP